MLKPIIRRLPYGTNRYRYDVQEQSTDRKYGFSLDLGCENQSYHGRRNQREVNSWRHGLTDEKREGGDLSNVSRTSLWRHLHSFE